MTRDSHPKFFPFRRRQQYNCQPRWTIPRHRLDHQERPTMIPYTDLCLTLSPQQEALKQGIHQFAREVLRPAAMALDRIPNPQQVIDSGSLLWTTLNASYTQ